MAECADPERAAELAMVLHWRTGRGSYAGAITDADRIAARLPPGSPIAAELHLFRGELHATAGAHLVARAALAEAERCLADADPASAGWIAAQIDTAEGRIRGTVGEEGGEALLRRAIDAFDALGDRFRAGNARRTLATYIGYRDPDAAEAMLHEALADMGMVGTPLGVAGIQAALGWVIWTRGDLARASVHEARALELMRQSGERAQLASLLSNQGSHLMAMFELDRAEVVLREALELHRRHGTRRGHGYTVLNLAALELLRRRPAEALELATAALAELGGMVQEQADARVCLGLVHLSLERWSVAIASFGDALSATRGGEPLAWAGLALGWLGAGDRARATDAAAHVHGPMAAILADAFADAPEFAAPVPPGAEVLAHAVEHVWRCTRARPA